MSTVHSDVTHLWFPANQQIDDGCCVVGYSGFNYIHFFWCMGLSCEVKLCCRKTMEKRVSLEFAYNHSTRCLPCGRTSLAKGRWWYQLGRANIIWKGSRTQSPHIELVIKYIRSQASAHLINWQVKTHIERIERSIKRCDDKELYLLARSDVNSKSLARGNWHFSPRHLISCPLAHAALDKGDEIRAWVNPASVTLA